MVGMVSSLYIAGTYLGESLGGYVIPWLSKTFMGSTASSACLIVSGIGCIVMGIISIPSFRKGYPIAFPKKTEE